MNLSARSFEPELMDNLDCQGEVVDQTLRELDVINKWLGGNHVTLSGIERLLRQSAKKSELQIVDLGTGSGEMLNMILKWAHHHQHPVRLLGVDANPHIIRYAQKAKRHPQVDFKVLDVFSDEFSSIPADVFVATLFLHHFTNDQLVTLFKKLNHQAKVGIVVNDIHRHWFAFHSIRLLTRFFSNSPMVKFDAPLSVRRAFTRSELVDILQKAGIANYSLTWKWAFRWQLVIPKTLA